MSRSQHQSQGMGAGESKGTKKQYLVRIAGEPAEKDVFEGIDTSWNRIPDGAAVGAPLAEAQQAFQPAHPETSLPVLGKARARLAPIKDPEARRTLAGLDASIALGA